MLDILKELSSSPVPNILVVAGILFLLLSVAGKIGGNLSVPARRQKVAATIGVGLLVSGVSMFMIPAPAGQASPGDGDSEAMASAHVTEPMWIKAGDEDAAAIVSTLDTAANQEIVARKSLDDTALELVYHGDRLRSMKGLIHTLRSDNVRHDCRLESRVLHSTMVTPDGQKALAEITEDWNCAAYDLASGNCLEQYAEIKNTRQVVYLVRQDSAWMVDVIDFATELPGGTKTGRQWVTCTAPWPETWSSAAGLSLQERAISETG